MIEKLVLVMILACPVMMAVMMLLMWRGMRGHRHAPTTGEGEAKRQTETDYSWRARLLRR